MYKPTHKKMRLFHYTDLAGYQGIQQDRVIHASKRGRYGRGVYLTDLEPDNDLEFIAQQLYHGGAQRNLQRGRLDHYIELDIPKRKLVCERIHVYRFLGNKDDDILYVDWYHVVSEGSCVKWGTAEAAVAVGIAGTFVLASKLYRNATTGRQDRTEKLFVKLEQIKVAAGNFEYADFQTRRKKDGNSVCVNCQTCQKQVSSTYHGGLFYSDSIDSAAVLDSLRLHELQHALFVQLDQIITAGNFKYSDFQPRRSEGGNSVHVCCQTCHEPISETTFGGNCFPNTIDRQALLNALRWHEFQHMLASLGESLLKWAGIFLALYLAWSLARTP